MASDITIAGHKFKAWEVWTVGLGGALVTFLAWRAHSASSSTVTDPTTGQTYPADGTDPVTGLTYAAEISEYGSVEAAESAVTDENTGDLGDESGLANGYSYSSGEPDYYGTGTTSGTTGYTSNSDWASAVIAGLESLGFSSADVNGAIAAYLAGMSLTSTQASIVKAALGEFGPPPTGSFPVSVTPGSPAPATTQVTVPNVVGQPQEAAYALISEEGLKPATTTPPVKGKTIYVKSQDPTAGTKVDKGSKVTVTSAAQTSVTKPKKPLVTTE